ncbi:MAG: glycosyl hydrolase family 65 protein, partial [Bacteroidota bacterium]
VVEAYPENNMKHLSAESALYCRIFIEGMLGLEPINFDRIKIKPQLPENWDYLELKNMAFGGWQTDILIHRKGGKVHLKVKSKQKVLFDQEVATDQAIEIDLRP